MSFFLSKILWFIASPGNLLVLLMVAGALMSMSRHPGAAGAGRALILVLALAALVVAALPVDEWLVTPIENRFVLSIPGHVDGIILLGGDENPRVSDRRGQGTANNSMPRYIRFAELARQYPDARLLFTGGSDSLMPYDGMKAADVAKEILNSLGVPQERMTYEDMSRNTHENAVLSANIVHPASQQNWLMVTSATHMPRAMGIFRKEGWNVYPVPVGYITDGATRYLTDFDFRMHLYALNVAVHEYIGLMAAWLMGYSDTLWPG